MLRHCDILGLGESERGLIEAHAASFDQTLPWFEAFEAHLASPGTVRYLVAYDADRPCAVLPLRVERLVVAGPLQAQAIGSLTNYYTAFYSAIGPGSGMSAVVPSVAKSLVDAAHGVDLVDLNPMAQDDTLLASMHAGFSTSGWIAETYERFGNWYLPVHQISYADYLAQRPGKLRSTLARKSKRLMAINGARIQVVTESRDVPDAMARYESIYKSSWKVDEPHKEFIRDVATRFAGLGWLRLGLVEVQDRPIAAQLWFVYRGTASIFKLAYDPEYAELSPGSILTSHLMQFVLERDKVGCVDYLSGDDEYKRDWMTHRRQRVGFRATRRASAAGVMELAKRAIRFHRRNGLQSATT